MSKVLETEIAKLRAAADKLPAQSGARWLLWCAAQTLTLHLAQPSGPRPALRDVWDEWDAGDGGAALTALSPLQRLAIGEVAARLGSHADAATDALTRAACEDAARGLYEYLLPDADLGDDPE